MDWPEFAAARQLAVEMHIGTRVREAKATEDAIAKRNKKALGGK